MPNKKIKILFTGGGTGGHLMPVIAVSREIRRLHPKSNLEIHYIGPKDELSLLLLAQENIKTHNIVSGKIRRYFAFENITDILSKTILVGNPIKKELTEGNKEDAREIFNLTLEKPVVLFLGGSQGAQPLNDFVLTILNDLLQDFETIHLCGSKNYKNVKMESRVILDKESEKYYHLWEFLDEVQLKHAYKAADIIISRAGAGSIFEIAACGKPSILVPLPESASNHQSKNAYQYSSTGAAVLIEQGNLTHNFFVGKINYLLSNPEKMENMKQAALQFAKPLAAKAVAREILEYLNIND